MTSLTCASIYSGNETQECDSGTVECGYVFHGVEFVTILPPITVEDYLFHAIVVGQFVSYFLQWEVNLVVHNWLVL